MLRTARSQLNSPACKRQRLSSPTYDDQIADLSQEYLDAFDKAEARLSQEHNSQDRATSSDPSTLDGSRSSHSTMQLSDDSENPFRAGASEMLSNPTLHSTPTIGFSSASRLVPRNELKDGDGALSPENSRPEQKWDNWFQDSLSVVPDVFQPTQIVPTLQATTPLVGFQRASNKGWIKPSATALAKARQKLKDIWDDDGSANGAAAPTQQIASDDTLTEMAQAQRVSPGPECPVLHTLHNFNNSPRTPTPTGFTRPNAIAVQTLSAQHIPFSKPKPFRSPLLHKPSSLSKVTPATAFASSPLNPNRPNPLAAFTSAASRNPSSVPASAPGFSKFSLPSTPLRSNAPGGVKRHLPAFVTPFKPGMRPGEPGRSVLDEHPKTQPQPENAPPTRPTTTENWLTAERRPAQTKDRTRLGYFNLKPPPNRLSLSLSGLQPHQYDQDTMESMGVNVAELLQITPSLAPYYSFHTSSSTPLASLSTLSSLLGPAAAFDELLDQDCVLATKPWVDNHWCLILWKLAGMVGLDPSSESDPKRKRWCWAEVMRQLLYRYERELNSGSRPPLRLITTQDSPASLPLVLCVSGITWSSSGISDEGEIIEAHPELEVTDGWYRLRAQVDAPLARAIRRGIIRIGRKIGVVGARLSSEKKDPVEILEAYNSVKLMLFGNSSHLAPWHAKLGFQRGPSVSTLHSLSADGGLIACLDLKIVKVYPIAYFEFLEKDGQQSREGPRNEVEETKLADSWQKRRELEASKLRSQFDKKFERYEGYIGRLEMKFTRPLRDEEDVIPDRIESLYDDLDEHASALKIIGHMSGPEPRWLARVIRERIDAEREALGMDMEKELDDLCPRRNVRSFRVLIVKDAEVRRRPAHRTAQLTVWDVTSLNLTEGGPAGLFKAEQRYLVSNLMPTQLTAWMNNEPGAEIFMATRRDSQWKRIKSE